MHTNPNKYLVLGVVVALAFKVVPLRETDRDSEPPHTHVERYADDVAQMLASDFLELQTTGDVLGQH